MKNKNLITIEQPELLTLLKRAYIDGCRDGYMLRDKAPEEFKASLKRIEYLFSQGLEHAFALSQLTDIAPHRAQ